MNWKIFSVVFVIVALGMVWQRVKVRTLERESARLHQSIDSLRYENGLLDAKIHHWVSPTNLDLVARQNYGMAPANPAQQDVLK